MLSPCHSRREPGSSCPPRPPARHGASAGLNASLTSMRDCFPTCRRVALPHVLTCYRNQNSFKPRLPYHHGRQTKLGMLGIRFRRNSARCVPSPGAPSTAPPTSVFRLVPPSWRLHNSPFEGLHLPAHRHAGGHAVRGARVATESRESLHLQVDAGRTLVSRSPQLHRIWGVVQRVAPTDVSVLVTGETGTGKEIIGRLIHKLSVRAPKEFVAVDCNAVAPSLLESELFGHERGAFTGADHRRAGVFELADGTTLFLDEVANLPLEAQAKMLRVLQEREFRRIGGQHLIRSDFRLITATNADLTSAVRVGSFREDLFHRLNVVHIHLPPLRERRQDIPLLMSYFIDQKRLRLKRPGVQRVSHQAVDLLMSYDWPGNVRELENVIETAMLECTGDMIEISHLVL